MSAYTLIRECSRKGVALTADGDNLKIKTVKGAVPTELKDVLVKAKPELYEVLVHMQELGFSWNQSREAWSYVGVSG